MGQLMVLHRRALRAIGGLESAAGELVDDMALGLRLPRPGIATWSPADPVPVIEEGLSLREFLRIYVRWLTFGRTGLPGLSFKSINWLHGMVFFAGLAAAVAAAAEAGAPRRWSTPPCHCGGREHRHPAPAERAAGCGRGHLWVPFMLLLIAPAILLRVQLQRQVSWRGRTYRLAPIPVGGERRDRGARAGARGPVIGGPAPRP